MRVGSPARPATRPRGILQLLALEPEFEVVAACGDLPEVLEAVERDAPDAVLTDIRMPPSHSDEGIRIATGSARRIPRSVSSWSVSTTSPCTPSRCSSRDPTAAGIC